MLSGGCFRRSQCLPNPVITAAFSWSDRLVNGPQARVDPTICSGPVPMLISYSVGIHTGIYQPCSYCSIQLVRQAGEWSAGLCGPDYLFWSCADVNIVQCRYTYWYILTCSNCSIQLVGGGGGRMVRRLVNIVQCRFKYVIYITCNKRIIQYHAVCS